MLSHGRCAQDQCYLEELAIEDLPAELIERWDYKVEDVVPLDSARLLVFFQNGEVKAIDMHDLLGKFPACQPYVNSENRFNQVEVQPGGYGIMWSEQAEIPDHDLYEQGLSVPLSLQDFCRFVQVRIVSATEACKILNCSRQNIDDLIKRGKLHPIRNDIKYKLFLRNEVSQRKRGR